MKMIEMAHVVQATMVVPGCPVLTSNQAHAVAMKLREVIEQNQGEPVAWLRIPSDAPLQLAFLNYDSKHSEIDIENALSHGFTVKRLYTHADAGELERLSSELAVTKKLYSEACQASYDFGEMQQQIDTLRAQLSKRDALLRKAQSFVEAWDDDSQEWMDLSSAISNALSGSAEPSPPVERDDPCNWNDQQVMDFLGVALRNVDLQGEVRLSEIRQGFQFMKERSALERKQ